MTEAEDIVRALGGDWRHTYGLAPCPICQTEARGDQRGLSVKNASGRTLLTCHKSGCSAVEVFRELRRCGAVQEQSAAVQHASAEIQRNRQKCEQQKAKTQRYCDDLFESAVPITGTSAEAYLKSSGISVQGSKLRNTLRFHPALRHPHSEKKLPAMVARLRGPGGKVMGIHRTFLNADGSRKADLPCGAKMMLGACGGGAVRFGPDRQVIALAEGIETALSIGMASRLTVWATLSTSGMKGVHLPCPPVAEVVVIAADHDPAGLKAAQAAANRFEREGRTVSIITPQSEGADFNDVLQNSAHG